MNSPMMGIAATDMGVTAYEKVRTRRGLANGRYQDLVDIELMRFSRRVLGKRQSGGIQRVDEEGLERGYGRRRKNKAQLGESPYL